MTDSFYSTRPPWRAVPRADLRRWYFDYRAGRMVVCGWDCGLQRWTEAAVLWWSDGRVGTGERAQERVFRLRDADPDDPYPACW